MPDIRQLALVALSKLAASDKRQIIAGRKGLCAAVQNHGEQTVVFRRKAGTVRLELWPNDGRHASRSIEVHPLPADLQARAAQLLDSLI